jgi:hypothetical protein
MQIYYRGNREMVRDAVIGVVRSVTGNSSDHAALAQAVHTAIGVAALSDIKSDFVTKARGGVGEDGVKWPPLDPKTLAYHRRFGKGEQAALKKAAGLGRGNRFAPGQNKGLLTAAQLKRWRQIYASRLRKFAASMDIGEAKAKAAAIAWKILKDEGAKTKLEVYGHREHEILRDTGVMLNSLSIGVLSPDGSYEPPADQIFRVIDSGVIVGTNVPYASVHQNGSDKRGIPARPFLPKDSVPVVWLNRWRAAASRAITGAIRYVFAGGSIT